MTLATFVMHPVRLPAALVLQWFAYAAGFQLYLTLGRRWPGARTMTFWQNTWIFSTATLCAFVGSKLLAWADNSAACWEHRTDWHFLLAQKTILGAFLGGWVGIEAVKKWRKIDASGDVYVFPLILGLILGRAASLFAAPNPGIAVGLPTALPWGIDFGDGMARHPLALYEMAFLLLAAGGFGLRMAFHKQRGCMFSQFMAAYLAYRCLAEFLRQRQTLPVIPMGVVQLACLAGIAYAIRHWNDTCCENPLAVPSKDRPATTSLAAPAASDGPEFYELINSLCPLCLNKIEAKIVIKAGQVFMHKFCPDHGSQRVLISADAAYWRESRTTFKPPTPPLRRNTALRRGCPYDCGLCPDHEQHSCVAIVEITDQCDLGCSFCYAGSHRAGAHRSLAHIEQMLDAVVANEGKVNVVQISGGEPTLHPEFFAVLDAVRDRPIKHLMINTHGGRIAQEPAFVKQLAAYMPGMEVYLQFDSLRGATLKQLRGLDLSTLRRRALDALNAAGISTTLVVTLKKGVNDDQIGEILDFALQQPCVRGVTFQPIQAAGRLDAFDPVADRLTVSDVRSAILRQHSLFTPQDIAPVPCHPDTLAMGYALRQGKTFVPLSRLLDPHKLLHLGGNTICYEQDPAVRKHLLELFSTAASPVSAAVELGKLCCLGLTLPVKYNDVFRVIIMQFMDAWSMDLRSVKRSCVHIVHPDLRLIPFDTYNVLYRGKV